MVVFQSLLVHLMSTLCLSRCKIKNHCNLKAGKRPPTTRTTKACLFIADITHFASAFFASSLTFLFCPAEFLLDFCTAGSLLPLGWWSVLTLLLGSAVCLREEPVIDRPEMPCISIAINGI